MTVKKYVEIHYIKSPVDCPAVIRFFSTCFPEINLIEELKTSNIIIDCPISKEHHICSLNDFSENCPLESVIPVKKEDKPAWEEFREVCFSHLDCPHIKINVEDGYGYCKIGKDRCYGNHTNKECLNRIRWNAAHPIEETQ